MKTKKCYKVVACIGRRRNVIYETAPFNEGDGQASWNAWKDATREKEKYCMSLWAAGFSYTNHGTYHHIGKNIEAGRIQIFMYSK